MTLALGAAAGGMLASAFLSTAVAFADDPPVTDGDTVSFFNPNTLDPELGTNPLVESVNGIPPLFQDISGFQFFDVDDVTAQGSSPTLVPVGTAEDYYSNWTLAGGISNTEYTIAAFAPNEAGEGITFANLPGDGSVYDTLNLGSGLDNVYSDVLTGTGSSATSTVTDLLQFDGTTILNLTPVVDAFGLSPADFTLGLLWG